jgi:NAD+ kinase
MRVMLVPNELYETSVEASVELEGWLDEQGIDVVHPPHFGDDEGACLEGVDLVVSFGGDGTLLRAAHLVGPAEIPILGLSYGHLGFLTADANLDQADMFQLVGQALAQELHVTRRSVLSVTLEGVDARGNEVQRQATAVNEAVLARGASGRMVEFDVSANGVHIDRLRGDGFVVSTATGSTGYALSAGGPIVTPDFAGLVCVPIAPHTITARAFITSPSDVVELQVASDRSSDPCVFVDGETAFADVAPRRLSVSRADYSLMLLTVRDQAFFESVSRVFYGKVR